MTNWSKSSRVVVIDFNRAPQNCAPRPLCQQKVRGYDWRAGLEVVSAPKGGSAKRRSTDLQSVRQPTVPGGLFNSPQGPKRYPVFRKVKEAQRAAHHLVRKSLSLFSVHSPFPSTPVRGGGGGSTGGQLSMICLCPMAQNLDYGRRRRFAGGPPLLGSVSKMVPILSACLSVPF